MNDGQFLIPANSKKSMLLFGLFRKIDLIILGCGLLATLILLLTLELNNIVLAIIALTPGLVTAFLVIPIPNYHNMLCAITSIFRFYTTRQKYVWKGWCYKDESNSKQ